MIKLAYVGQHSGFFAIEYNQQLESMLIALDDGNEIMINVEDAESISLALSSFKGDSTTCHLTVDISGTRLFIPFEKSAFDDAYSKVERFAKQWDNGRSRITSKRPARGPREPRRRKERVH